MPTTCRQCDRSTAEGARFSGLSRTRCADCNAARRARADEIHAILRPEQAPPPVWLVAINHTELPPHAHRSGDCPAHLRWVRGQPCPVRSNRCHLFPMHAHHVRIGGTGGGMGLKPGDEWTVPLCALHHDELHTLGQVGFDRKHGVCLRALAQELAAKSPALKSPLTI